MKEKKIYILVAGLAVLIVVGLKFRVPSGGEEIIERDTDSNVFQEIKILKQKNEDLKKEIGELEQNIKQLTDRNLALQAIQAEVEKYEKLSGRSAVFGPGASVKIVGKIGMPWFVDLVNELFGNGAQAIAVNGIRITNNTAGFDILPQGQILLNGSILSSPYVFESVCEPAVLIAALEAPGGILSRLKQVYPTLEIVLNTHEVIQMK